MKKYKVYLVGAGPGGKDLISVRGLNILRQADVVIYDYLVDKRILEEVKPKAELICCDRLGKKRYNELLVRKAKEGKKVIRLKNGDPSIFGRLSQELDSLVKNRIEFEIVPGVTAASLSSSLSGIPLTDRRFASSCVFVTGHEDSKKKTSSVNWKSLAQSGTLVLYMAVESLKDIVNELIKAGKPKGTPVAIIQDAGALNQKFLLGTLKDIIKKAGEQKLIPPALIIIGEVVRLEREFNWLKANKRILFTGLSEERFFLKGRYFHLPLIKIEPLNDYREFDNYLRNIGEFDWIAFTSRFGVQYFFERLNDIGCDSRILKDIKVAAIGNSTRKKLLDFGIRADLVPKHESSKGLLEVFKKIGIKGESIFSPRSDIADKGLTKGLKNLGAKVISSIAYRNVMPKDLPDLNLDFFDEVMFSSPSGVRNFVKRYGKPSRKIKISTIGEVTQNEAKKWNLLD